MPQVRSTPRQNSDFEGALAAGFGAGRVWAGVGGDGDLHVTRRGLWSGNGRIATLNRIRIHRRLRDDNHFAVTPTARPLTVAALSPKCGSSLAFVKSRLLIPAPDRGSVQRGNVTENWYRSGRWWNTTTSRGGFAVIGVAGAVDDQYRPPPDLTASATSGGPRRMDFDG